MRLQKALGWTTLELDQAITALRAQDLTAEFLMQISQIRRLQLQLTIPIIEMLSWWSAISTAVIDPDSEEVSFYESLFLNNAVLSPADEAFALRVDRSDLENAGTAAMGDHTAALLAALAITEAELSLCSTTKALTRLMDSRSSCCRNCFTTSRWRARLAWRSKNFCRCAS